MTWLGWVASWCPFLIFPLRVCCHVPLNGVHLLSVQTVSVASQLSSPAHVCWARLKRKKMLPQLLQPGSSAVCKPWHFDHISHFKIHCKAFAFPRRSRWCVVAHWHDKITVAQFKCQHKCKQLTAQLLPMSFFFFFGFADNIRKYIYTLINKSCSTSNDLHWVTKSHFQTKMHIFQWDQWNSLEKLKHDREKSKMCFFLLVSHQILTHSKTRYYKNADAD